MMVMGRHLQGARYKALSNLIPTLSSYIICERELLISGEAFMRSWCQCNLQVCAVSVFVDKLSFYPVN